MYLSVSVIRCLIFEFTMQHFKHIFADTLRSLAVIVAALVAELADSVTSEEADATAAVIVSSLILMSLAPLLGGMVATFGELRSIYAEERDEILSSKQVLQNP
jgi:Co/Zn/Cd efflux system component